MNGLKGTDAVAEQRVETADVIKMSIVVTLACWFQHLTQRPCALGEPGRDQRIAIYSLSLLQATFSLLDK